MVSFTSIIAYVNTLLVSHKDLLVYKVCFKVKSRSTRPNYKVCFKVKARSTTEVQVTSVITKAIQRIGPIIANLRPY